jgi:hypothetical protein
MNIDRALRIPAGDQELTVEVVGDVARLGLRGRRDEGGEDGAGSTDGSAGVEVPARALVAALRAAWADAHDAMVFEPWRSDASGGRYGYRDRDGYGYGRYDGYGRYGYGSGWDPRDDDLGDGDPDGYRDPTVVPFPNPPRPPVPARCGLPWEPEEEVTIRAAWLGADPEGDRDAVLREVAAAVERGVGGVSVRLRRVGCDPTRPGCALDQPWLTGTPGAGEG